MKRILLTGVRLTAVWFLAFSVLWPSGYSAEVSRKPFQIRETAGIRRFGYPASAQFSFAPGELGGPQNARLISDAGKALSAQMTTGSRHPDGSVRELEVDFVLSPGPLEVTSLSLEYGPQVLTEAPTRGLVFSETEQHFKVSACTIRRDANPLIQGVFYDREYLDDAGITVSVLEGSVVHRLQDAKERVWTVEKRGPVQVRLRCEGIYAAQGKAAELPFVLILELVSTKSWIGITHSIPALSGRTVTLQTSADFRMSGQLLWDLDVGYWLYGVIDPTDELLVSQKNEDWHCRLIQGGHESVYAASVPGRTAFRGWGHFQEARAEGNVVAFGVTSRPEGSLAASGVLGADPPKTDERPTDELRMSLDSQGMMQIQTESDTAGSATQQVFMHFVPVPLQHTARTSPPSMMIPLQFVASKVEHQ